MKLEDLRDKNILIWGFGKEGQSVLGLLQSTYPNQKFTILSDKKVSNDIKNGLSNTKNLEFKTEAEGLDETLSKADVVVKSPGISLHREEIKCAIVNGTIFTSSTNIWFGNHKGGKVIVVTGTKGKSTTASLIACLLERDGKSVKLAGNIGTPLVDLLIENKNYDYYVMELSSYQTADLNYSPNIGVLLNLYPEHIEWHGSHRQYYVDKLRLFNNRGKDDIVVFNYNDETTRGLTTKWENIAYFNDPQGIHLEDETIYDGHNKLCDSSAVSLRGHHNLINVCAALTAIKMLDVNIKDVIPNLKTFHALSHRMEEIWVDNKGIKYINDSISTIPEAAIAAMEAFKSSPITLIAGGMDRQQDYEELARYIIDSTFVKNVIAVPDTGAKIATAIKEELEKNPNPINKPEVIQANNLDEAVKSAKEVTEDKGIILLSPAAPSYNTYQNFQERGMHFEQLAKS